MATKIDYVSDWAARLLSRTYEQFKSKARMNAIATKVLAPQFQALEDAMQAVLTMSSIDDSEGAQLDLLGRLVGQPRNSVDDPTYRLYLRARVRANRSGGRVTDLYQVFRLLLGAGRALRLFPGRVASFMLQVSGATTSTEAAVGLDFLADTKDAGVRGILLWQEYEDDDMFTTAVAVTLAEDVPSGATLLPVTYFDLAAFSATGSVTLDPGLATEEEVEYDALVDNGDGSYDVSLVDPTMQDHDRGAAVELVGDPGQGFGDSGDMFAGGRLAGAAQA